MHMATRRTSEERTKIFKEWIKEWSGQERPWLDYLDMKVADILVKTEDGRIYLKDDLNDEENKLYYKWDRRNHDPSYCRVRLIPLRPGTLFVVASPLWL
jgi:hypothetical protein